MMILDGALHLSDTSFPDGELDVVYGLTTLNKPKSREVSTNDGIITQNIFNAAVPTSIETK